MRISGNYFERLLIHILPYTVIASVIIYLVDNDLTGTVVVFSILTGFLWTVDTLIIFFKYRPKTLHAGKTLRCGRSTIPVNEIVRLIPVTERRRKWSFDMVELQLDNGTTYIIFDKPRTMFAVIWDKPSGTIRRLLKRYPELEGKDWRRRFV